MKRKKRILSTLCLVLLLTGILSSVAFAKEETQDSQFSVEITYGYNKYVKYGRYIPVYLDITNSGENFQGQVEVVVAEDYVSQNTAYIKDIVLNENDSRTVEICIPTLSNNGKIRVNLVDDKGRSIYHKDVRVRMNYSDDIFVGILSDDYNSLNYFDGLTFEDTTNYVNYNTRIFELDTAHFPEDPNALDCLNMIVVNNFDTSQLSDKQYEALKYWVEAGGTLMVGTGAAYSKSMGMFSDDYITGTFGDLTKETTEFGLSGTEYIEPVVPVNREDEQEQLEEQERLEEENLSEANSGAVSETKEAAAYSVSPEEGVDVVELEDVQPVELDVLNMTVDGSQVNDSLHYNEVSKGEGRVIIYNFDLGSENFLNFKYNRAVIHSTFSRIAEAGWNRIVNNSTSTLDYWSVNNMILNSLGAKLPKISGYAIILFVYVLLVGPVLYIVLKKLDKRHLLWGIVPAASVCFVLIMFFLGSPTRRKEPFINYASLVNLNEGEKEEMTYFSSTSPNNRPYSFNVGNEYKLNAITNNYSYGYMGTSEEADLDDYNVGIKYGTDGTQIRIRDVRSFNTNYFAGSRPLEEQSTDEITADISYDDGTYIGTVSNNTAYDLQDVSVQASGDLIKVGDIPAGKTVDVNQKSGSSSQYYYGYAVAESVLGANVWDGNGDLEAQTVRQNKFNILSQFVDNRINNNIEKASSVVLTAFTRDYMPVLGEQTGYETNGMTMFYENVKINYTKDGIVSIPNLAGYVSIKSGEIYLGDFILYSDEGELEYTMGSDVTVDEVSTKYPSGTSNKIKVYFYNYETDAYEPVFENSDTETDMARFLNGDNTLRVKLEKQTAYQYDGVQIPVFSAKGRAK